MSRINSSLVFIWVWSYWLRTHPPPMSTSQLRLRPMNRQYRLEVILTWFPCIPIRSFTAFSRRLPSATRGHRRWCTLFHAETQRNPEFANKKKAHRKRVLLATDFRYSILVMKTCACAGKKKSPNTAGRWRCWDISNGTNVYRPSQRCVVVVGVNSGVSRDKTHR